MKLETRGNAQRAKAQVGVNWVNGVFIIGTHLATVAALFFWSWPAVITAVVFYWVAGSLGIGMGYHRLLTHRVIKFRKRLNTFSPFAAPQRSRVVRFSGSSRIAYITRTQI